MSDASPTDQNHGATLFALVFSKAITQALGVVAELRIADLLSKGPKTAAELAAQTELDERALHRIMRLLASHEVFVEHPGGLFSLTPVGALLDSTSPSSMRDMAIMFADPVHNLAYAHLMHSARTGETGFSRAHGSELFQYWNDDPRFFEVFNNAMASNSRRLEGLLTAHYDFSKASRVADIGGGYGALMIELLRDNEHLHGVLFDLPDVVARAAGHIKAAGMEHRITTVGGSFFDDVPIAADIIMMKHIIHDWDDDKSALILSNCAATMTPDSRLLLIEFVVPESSEQHVSKLLDMEMLVIAGGQERTRAQYEALFERAGLTLTQVIETDAGICLIEGARA